MKKMLVFRLLWVSVIILGTACSRQDREQPLFELLSPQTTGITFSNDIIENDTLNVIDYSYLYNGSGVGVGDVNNDGLNDIFFAGNMKPGRLYLNQGNSASAPFHFEDITQQAGININRWSTGVALVDINQDGWLDIYVCVASKFNKEESKNLLYINNGTSTGSSPTFTESAEAYGLADSGYSTQAAFLDYDQDGDLDMYLLTNGMENFNHNNSRPKKVSGEGISNDKLYRNEGNGPEGQPVFTDITRQANILKEGYGLGVAVADFNQDGLPDIYAANDFITNDLLWINNGDGTFTDRAPEYLKHQTHNGMGVDVADYNNDGLVDIVVLDMLPEDNQRQKSMLGKPNYDRFTLNLDLGYTPQYLRNTLQLNNGLTPEGKLSFSEIGQLAGVYKTDWSWSALFSDYDNDGYRDLLITNGYVKDVTDLDYIVYQSSASQFGTQETKEQKSRALTSLLKEAKVHNYIFKNNHDLTFTDKSAEWGLDIPSFSNGAAFADLDNDGDLDLVMNNINAPAFVYENKADQLGYHFLRIKLQGPEGNIHGLGASLTLWYDDQKQYHYHSVYRGYKSTVEDEIHFGLGQYHKIDSMEVMWPDGKRQLLKNVPADQVVTLEISNATEQKSQQEEQPVPLFRNTTKERQLQYRHQEADFVDFKYQTLLHRKYSQDSPGAAVGDINSDGLDDLYVGGAKGQAGSFFIQHTDGQFSEKKLEQDTASEDMGSLLLDVDADGDMDLYVVSGGNEYHEGHEAYQDRLYLNDGKGNFTKAPEALPAMLTSGSCVVAADYDQDGDLDLFVGGRIRAQKYPMPPRSYLLRNDHGKFTDITQEAAPELTEPGLVTAALWTDFNQDGQIDLMVVGEWMSVRFFSNKSGQFHDVTASTGLHNTSGWWNSLISGDFDMDGDLDYIAGNLGLNSKYKASPTEPVSLYTKDYDYNRSIDPILCYYIMGEEYPAHARDALTDQIILMRRQFPRYAMYGDARFSDILSEQDLEGAYILQSKRMATSYLENLGNGKFSIRELPMQAQFSPAYGMASDDFNQDGKPDLLITGNSYAANVQDGWYDASVGTVLLGNGKGGFSPLSMQESGFFVDTDAKGIAKLHTADGQTHLLITSNADSAQVWTVQQEQSQIIALQPDEYYALVKCRDGRTYKEEFYYGNSYLSQSSRWLKINPKQVKKVTIYDFQGRRREIQEEAWLTKQ